MQDPVAPVPAADTEPAAGDRRATVALAIVFAVFTLLGAGLVALVVLGRGGVAAAPTSAPGDYAYAPVKPAPTLQLTDQDGRPFSLASLAGRPVLVFFGYTHCPDVCPATVGIINAALARAGPGPRVAFVTIDPERDDAAAMKSYLRYLPPAYTGLTGTADEIRHAADAWGVQYAKQDTFNGTGYGMAHTADVFLVDAQGRLRAHFPFGTTEGPIASALAGLLRETPAPSDAGASSPSPVASPSDAPAASQPAPSSPSATPASSAPASATGSLHATVVSSEVWAGGPDPVILAVTDAAGTPLDGRVPIDVTVLGAGNAAAGPPVRAVAVRPWGETTVYYVATVTIPSPGEWQLSLAAAGGASGEVAVSALDQGGTAALGGPAPDVHTPTLADVGGNIKAVTTQPQPDPRLYQASTSDARAQGKPYVIVIDSTRFRVSPLCGKAIVMIRYLLDRWPDVAFIHLEPFEYQIITEEPVLSGSIDNPPLNAQARAFGIGGAVWDAKSVPWVFVVDGQGIVRAKYHWIIGSTDVDVIISLIQGNGVIGG
jgi:protein SCO1/2